jgi:hypothetical protein
VCHEDAGWEMLIKRIGLDVLEVWYEDLANEYEAQMRRVLAYLGLEESVQAVPKQPIERQSGPLNERLRRELVAYLGIVQHD